MSPRSRNVFISNGGDGSFATVSAEEALVLTSDPHHLRQKPGTATYIYHPSSH